MRRMRARHACREHQAKEGAEEADDLAAGERLAEREMPKQRDHEGREVYRPFEAAAMTAHTRGPWRIGRHLPTKPVEDSTAFEVQDERGQMIAVLYLQNRSIEGAEDRANAALIKAAPLMYAALKHAERFCPCGARPESPTTHPHVPGCPVALALEEVDGPP